MAKAATAGYRSSSRAAPILSAACRCGTMKRASLHREDAALEIQGGTRATAGNGDSPRRKSMFGSKGTARRRRPLI
eukprot:10873676-Alexandrium_andersonii.AAC.1